ncbi:hypothetical protein FHS43_006167 [Streptosporangium becharense]|uniref:Uncharacterized protein n=1 Tax=Streptosporangium becharense TaxID=1816182 RepID=A0A7W9MHD4_9ACTN|nr:hypothetical protein [Streptosporangium becharense]MBB2914855.1 hypothetical protein [Streptosporangium becharense]MBB5820334.1 hypothetical protein [Streptosporangium becharense]
MAELEMIRIRNPRIDGGGRVIEVPASALSHYQRSGWESAVESVEEPPTAASADPPPDGQAAPEQDTEAPETPGLSHATTESPRRRRASTKEGE